MGEEIGEGTVVKKKRKINWIVVLAGIFVFVLIFLLYTSFFNSSFCFIVSFKCDISYMADS